MDVTLGQDHRGVEADDREEARDVEDDLNDVFADCRFGVVELRRVVPSEGCAVVAMVDVAGGAFAVMAQTEDYRGIALVVVVVFDFDFDTTVG